MLTHLEPRVSCTACNSLGSKPPPYGFLWRYGNRNAVGADSIRPPEVRLTHAGAVVQIALQKVEIVYPSCRVLSYVLMPNHLHFLLEIRPVTQGGRQIAAPTVIGQFKRQVSRELGYSLWQKGYYDHIIRDEDDYLNKCRYIEENPAKWADDPYYNNSSAPA